ncbi:non-ribosomal peptide synthetase [Scytonema millei]|uniref:Non-ribosomal peptide synthetase n=1 Tax=Scytonema millei VB511283 TaxID=1245923 RepID=A0A9X5E5P1_9CYAN|nr:non-ribosomal peptide synthetase [Scytonema millei]NHC34669.1 non-ribosomal peptide synthetase [Scytonema millei VB511283]
MTSIEFLAYLRSLDIQLFVEGESLRCNAPEGVLSPQLRAKIVDRKSELIALLHQANAQIDRSPQLVRISRDCSLPLSFAQQRLWFLDRLVPNNPFYNIPFSVRLQGKLDYVALKQAFGAIVDRHEALRTNFVKLDGQPVQIVAEKVNLSLPVVDLRHLPPNERQLTAQQIATEEAQQPFNLATDLLLRVKLLQLDAAEYVLLLNLHHIVADGWSLGVLVRELGLLYTAKSESKPYPLPELPIQYADFAYWQRQWLQGQVLESQLSYWRSHLADLPILNLPTDRTRPAVQTYHGATQSLKLPKTLTQSLEALSQQASVTLFMTLLAAFQTLLHRYTGQEDIAVGSPIANRKHSQIEPLIGFFVNSLVLRVDLSNNPTFRELLERVRQVTLGAYAHQDLPFEKLVEELHPERDLSRNPLFQVVFALQNAPMQPLELPGLTLNPLKFDVTTTRFDLELHLWECDRGLNSLWEGSVDGLSGFVAYNTDLFDASTIARMLAHFQILLEGIVTNPDTRIANLPLLSAAEYHQLLVEWNQTSCDYPERCIHQLFQAQAAQSPDAVAVVFADEQLTYQQLDRRANQLAHYLQQLGVTSESLVGICSDRSLEMVVGILGIWKAGGAYIPLDPNYPSDRLKFMLDDTQVAIVLTQSSLAPLLKGGWGDRTEPGNEEPELAPLLKGGWGDRLICLDTDWETIATHSDETPNISVTTNNLAYVIYTSGSTGKPKGVLVEHRGLCNVVQAQIQIFKLQPKNRILQFSSLSFDASVFEMLLAFGVGASLYIPPKTAHLPGAELIQFLQDKAIDTTILPPAVLAVLPAAELPTLQTVISGGEAVKREIVQQWAVGRRFFNAYGPTEATIWATVAQLGATDNNDNKPSIGRPISNTQIYLLDSHLQPVPIGVVGELYISGDGLARGYLNRPQLTDERFVCLGSREDNSIHNSQLIIHNYQQPTPNSRLPTPDSRLYKTGDLARYLPDGNLEFVDRIDNQVKIRGFRIELGEIETLLLQHPTVREAVAIAHENATDKRIVAYIVPQDRDSHRFTTSDRQNFSSPTPDSLVRAHSRAPLPIPPLEQQLQHEQVKQWQNLYDQTYHQPATNSDATFNIVGWNSSYTNRPIPKKQMQQWVSDRTQQILSLQPQRVLEIGCGTGLLLFQIAPHCTGYWGTDFSSASIEYIEQQLATQPLPQVKLLQRMATDFEGLEANSFDAVILNSVVQYFPSVDYLLQVLEQAIHTVAPGGFVFIGDVRSLPLLSAFHAAVQLERADNTVSREHLQQQVQTAIFQETELAIDPAFFHALKQHLERIGHIQIQLTRGRYCNELTQFRYNVILHIESNCSSSHGQLEGSHCPPFQGGLGGSSCPPFQGGLGGSHCPPQEELARSLCPPFQGGLGGSSCPPSQEGLGRSSQLNWTQDNLNLAQVREHLVKTQPAVLKITGIPNARVVGAVKTAQWLEEATQAPKTAGKMREALEQVASSGIEPEDWWDLAAELSYTVDVSWSNADSTGCYDAIFQHQSATKNSALLPFQQQVNPTRPWKTYANDPLQTQFARHLISQLRSDLEQNLPQYMIPSAFVVLEALPLTPNGKVNRRALPAPELIKQWGADDTPRSPIEQKLANIWAELLGLKLVGLHDNFFQLGGHSLLATQLTSRIRDVFGVELPLRSVFESPQVAQLAKAIAHLQSNQPQQTPQIVPLSRDAHRRLRSSLNRDKEEGDR